jgi:hypothetical protein
LLGELDVANAAVVATAPLLPCCEGTPFFLLGFIFSPLQLRPPYYSVAKTGSGKTLGYLLPSFHSMLAATGGKPPPPPPPGGYVEAGKPSLLVLAPTRELACQIEGEATKFGRAVGLRATCVEWLVASGGMRCV